MLGQLAKQDLLGQRPLDLVLDKPRHRPRTHLHVVARHRQPATCRVADLQKHTLVLKLRLQFDEELVDDTLDGLGAQTAELDDGIQAVAELRREALADNFHGIGRMVLVGKADGRSRSGFSARVGGHDQDHVAEVGLAPVVIGQGPVVHDLQQQVEDFRVGLLDLIEQQHAVRLLGDGFGQQTALVEPDVARRRADQARHGVTLHVFGHVETHQLDTQRLGQLTRCLGLAHAGRAGEQERTDRLVRRLEPCARQLDGGRQRVDGRILTEHGQLQIPLQVTQQLLVGTGDMLGWNTGDLGDDVLDLRHVDSLNAIGLRLQALVGAGFVDDVDGLVGHVPVIDVARGQLCRCTQRLVAVLDVVMAFEAPFEAAQDTDGVLHGRLAHIDLLEAPRQRPVLLEDATKFLERRGTDAADFARRQQWLEQVGGVHDTARRCAGTNDGMDFVDEQDGLWPLAQFTEQRLEALLEVAAVFGTGQQSTQVE